VGVNGQFAGGGYVAPASFSFLDLAHAQFPEEGTVDFETLSEAGRSGRSIILLLQRQDSPVVLCPAK